MSKTQASSPNDADALLNDWLTTQGTALSTGLAQFTNGQLAMLTQWLELQVELTRQWQALLGDVWSPWSNVFGRGGEQLA